MATRTTINISQIQYGGELPSADEVPALVDNADRPIIVSDEGAWFDLLDGYHRLAGLLKAGATEASVIIPTPEEVRKCREFGGGWDAMSEADWIEWVEEGCPEIEER